MSSGGTVNPGAWGITNGYLGGNPVGRSPQPVQPPTGYAGVRDSNYGAGGKLMPGLGGGLGPGRGPRRDPGMPTGPVGPGGRPVRGGGGGGGGKGPKGGGGGQGGGGGNGMGGGMGWYNQLIQRMSMPMDARFEADRVSLENSLQSQLQQLRAAFNVGNAQLDESQLLGGEQIGEAFNDRGIFGSGLMALDNQRLSNDIAEDRLGLRSQFDQGRYGVQSDFRGGIQEALLALASRLQGQPGLPLPGRGPYGMNLGRGR